MMLVLADPAFGFKFSIESCDFFSRVPVDTACRQAARLFTGPANYFLRTPQNPDDFGVFCDLDDKTLLARHMRIVGNIVEKP